MRRWKEKRRSTNGRREGRMRLPGREERRFVGISSPVLERATNELVGSSSSSAREYRSPVPNDHRSGRLSTQTNASLSLSLVRFERLTFAPVMCNSRNWPLNWALLSNSANCWKKTRLFPEERFSLSLSYLCHVEFQGWWWFAATFHYLRPGTHCWREVEVKQSRRATDSSFKRWRRLRRGENNKWTLSNTDPQFTQGERNNCWRSTFFSVRFLLASPMKRHFPLRKSSSSNRDERNFSPLIIKSSLARVEERMEGELSKEVGRV